MSYLKSVFLTVLFGIHSFSFAEVGPSNMEIEVNDLLKNEQRLNEAIKENRPFSMVYNRNDWNHWIDADNDCMNTRHEALVLQADGPVNLSPNGCFVSSGLWSDPFSGKTLTRASDLDVDHVVPLFWAHTHGGANWSLGKKELFANDMRNLLVVDDGLNQKKGAKGPSEWMPPNQGFRCDYLKIWFKVLRAYPTLQFSPTEERIVKRQAKACAIP